MDVGSLKYRIELDISGGPVRRITIPEEMEEYAEDLAYFFETMIRKLYTNRHKGFERNFDIAALYEGVVNETIEMKKAAKEEGQFQAGIEAADVANMAFLFALMCWHSTRPHFDTEAAKI